MVDALYLPYLLVLLLLPATMWLRWGLAGAALATFLSFGLVLLVFYVLDSNHLFPKPYGGDPPPLTGPEEKSRWDQSVSGLLFFIWLYVPGCAVLAGGAVAILLAALMTIWRAVAGWIRSRRQQ